MKKRMSLQDKAEAALKKAVRQVVERHKKTGRSLAVWQNGKTVRISPNTVNIAAFKRYNKYFILYPFLLNLIFS